MSVGTLEGAGHAGRFRHVGMCRTRGRKTSGSSGRSESEHDDNYDSRVQIVVRLLKYE